MLISLENNIPSSAMFMDGPCSCLCSVLLLRNVLDTRYVVHRRLLRASFGSALRWQSTNYVSCLFGHPAWCIRCVCLVMPFVGLCRPNYVIAWIGQIVRGFFEDACVLCIFRYFCGIDWCKRLDVVVIHMANLN